MSNRAKMQLAAALLPAMAILAASPAAAQEPVVVYGETEGTRIERVKFADLDLSTKAGAKKLNARVGGAVRNVCLFDPEIRLQPSDYGECANESWHRAKPQIAQAIARSQALAASGQPANIAVTIAVSAR